MHGHVQDHIIKPIDNTIPVETSEYVYIYTYVLNKKGRAHMQKRHNKDIIMFYHDRHFVVVDIKILDDNAIHPHGSVICDTTLSKVHHIEV